MRFLTWMMVILYGVALPAAAQQLSQAEVEQWLEEPALNTLATDLVSQALSGNLAEVEFQLEQLKYPQQEVLRTLFVQALSLSQINLNPSLATLVEKQMHIPSVYYIVEEGDGYEFKVPAFNYPSTAASMLKNWKQQQTVMSFYMQSEDGTLAFRSWLNAEKKSREMLFLAEYDSLSPTAQHFIAEQVLKEAVNAWVPSSRIVVEIANSTKSPEIYALLWKMKSDGVIEREIDRLAETQQGELLIMAASHTSHYPQAINLLTRFSEPNQDVQLFLQSEIDRSGQGSVVIEYLKSNNNLKLLSTLNTP